jgi:hypothetical protein
MVTLLQMRSWRLCSTCGPKSKRSARLVAISPQLEPYSRDAIAQHKLSFDLLSDKARGCRLRASLHTTPGTWSASKKISASISRNTMATIHGRYPCSGDSSSNQSGIIRSAEADPDYTVRPRARSAQGNKRLLKSATAFSRLRSCALHLAGTRSRAPFGPAEAPGDAALLSR